MKNNHFLASLATFGCNLINFLSRHLVLLILAGAFIGRLYRINYPLLDHHSFRQADTASVTREFVKHRYPLWLPHYQDLGNIQSGLDNLEGYRFVEFPLVNYLLAQVIRPFSVLQTTEGLTLVSRLASVLASTLSCWFLYLLVYRWSKHRSLALLTAGAMAFLPFSLYYGRAVLPEPFQVLAILATLLAFTIYLQKPKLSWWLATFFSLALALLLKPTSIFVGPLLLVLAWQKYRWRAFWAWDLWLLAILALIPIFWWRQYLLSFPAGIPASDWLYNQDGIRLRPAWWRWLFWERLSLNWLGGLGLIFFIPGLLPQTLTSWRSWSRLSNRFTNLDWLTWFWTASCFAYLVVFATGNVRHDYYQVILLPIVCLILARGGCWLVATFAAFFHRYVLTTVLIVLALLAWFFAWERIRGNFNVNRWDYARAGQIVDQLTPSDAKIIVATLGDTSFLFQTNRLGWPIGVDVEEKISQGANYYVSTDFDSTVAYLSQIYPVVYQDEIVVLIKLQDN